MAPGTELSKVKATALSKQDDKLSQSLRVRQLLPLAMARQATVDSPTLKFFAASLSRFERGDIAAAIEVLCHKRREQGETAFPDLATIEEQIFLVRNARVRAEREEEEYKERERVRRHIHDHPKEHVTFAEIMADFMARWEAARREVKTAPPTELLETSEHLTAEHKAELRAILARRGGK